MEFVPIGQASLLRGCQWGMMSVLGMHKKKKGGFLPPTSPCHPAADRVRRLPEVLLFQYLPPPGLSQEAQPRIWMNGNGVAGQFHEGPVAVGVAVSKTRRPIDVQLMLRHVPRDPRRLVVALDDRREDATGKRLCRVSICVPMRSWTPSL
jgi:hypothetical protein